VIDGDGLFLLSQDLSILENGKKIILSPNAMEYKRIKESIMKNEKMEFETVNEEVNYICKKLGNVTIVLKGKHDIICNGSDDFVVCDEEGSLRRCGGQGIYILNSSGDVLAGSFF
jgi:ATP-dependent NAD(P)H-hydrate dehydratase